MFIKSHFRLPPIFPLFLSINVSYFDHLTRLGEKAGAAKLLCGIHALFLVAEGGSGTEQFGVKLSYKAEGG